MVLRRIFHFVDCFGVLQCVLSRRSSWRVERGQCNVIVPVFFIMIYDLFVWPCGLLALENAKTLREKYDDAVSVGGGGSRFFLKGGTPLPAVNNLKLLEEDSSKIHTKMTPSDNLLT